MRYYISSNFKNLSMNWDKYVFNWEKWNFDPKGNSALTAVFLVLEKALVLHTFFSSNLWRKICSEIFENLHKNTCCDRLSQFKISKRHS